MGKTVIFAILGGLLFAALGMVSPFFVLSLRDSS